MKLLRAAAGSSAALLLVGLTVGIDAGPAAAQTGLMVCTGSGAVQLTTGSASGVNWTVDLTGVSCTATGGTLGGTLDGTGTSDGLGLCPSAPSDPTIPLTVDNLNIGVTANLSGARGGVTVNDTWSAPVTTFPIATPFVITRGGTLVGAGTITTHIFAHCPPSGSPSAFVAWTELLPG